MPSSNQPKLIVGSFMDEADTKCFYGTLRSGQRIETELSVVIVGDVNSGAEVVAGGDIIVLGKLRGIAHAGAFDESGGGRFVFALSMEPTQLRIGQVISRGNDKQKKGRVLKSKNASIAPEIARVDKDVIVVDLYDSKNCMIQKI
ncbi:MAG: septum site-determining protein MinC [Candidatus Dadabacteria bacterium]|nr:MAG: septum site-determining protein MinC [Candidatus Dadabacteria bacterium]